jgi:hypothetical protein
MQNPEVPTLVEEKAHTRHVLAARARANPEFRRRMLEFYGKWNEKVRSQTLLCHDQGTWRL